MTKNSIIFSLILTSTTLMAVNVNDKTSIKEFIEKKKVECENKNKKACYQLGDYALFTNTKESAERYFLKACELGSPEACYELNKNFGGNF
jgi:TPR repeat protein